MTTEQKAKAYDDALKRASKLESPFYKQAAEIIFPELAESEDEKIRKTLIAYFNTRTGNFFCRLKVADIISYLEKQKESDGKAMLHIAEKFYEIGKRDGKMEQKEQKPRKFKLGDKVHLEGDDTNVITITGFRDDAYLTDSAYGPILYNEEDNWKIVKQKQQWSKEDENMLNKLIAFFHSISNVSVSEINTYISWLFEKAQSLRFQPKQKQQIKNGDKVSIHCREDRTEDMINIYDGKVGEVIYVWDAKRNPWGHIGVRLDNGCNSGFYEDELEILDQPRWKPSEEQLKALHTLNCFEELTYAGQLSELASLYNDLKKL